MGTATYFSPEQAQGFAGRRPQRRVLAGRRALRDGGGPPAVRRRQPGFHRLQARARGADACPARPTRPCPRASKRSSCRPWPRTRPTATRRPRSCAPTCCASSGASRCWRPTASAVAATNILTTVNEAEPDRGRQRRRRRFAALLVGLLVILGGARLLPRPGARRCGTPPTSRPSPSRRTWSASSTPRPRPSCPRPASARSPRWTGPTSRPRGWSWARSPPAGTAIKSNAKLVLSVSSGPAQVSVPDETGKTQAAAVADLKSKGLVPVVSGQASSSVPQGSVISTNPSAGTTILQGNKVTLVVSTGVQSVTIPSVAGEDPVTAASKLTSAGLVPQQEASTLDGVQRQGHRDQPAGGHGRLRRQDRLHPRVPRAQSGHRSRR